MESIVRFGSKQHSKTYFLVKIISGTDRLMKQGLYLEGKYHCVDKYQKVDSNTICPNCCELGHTTYRFLNPEKAICAICVEIHLIIEPKCPIVLPGICYGKHTLALKLLR